VVSGTLALRGGPALPVTADRAADGQSGLFRSATRLGREEGILALIRVGENGRGFDWGSVVNTIKEIASVVLNLL
jgi:hypothetical protein